MVCGGSPSSQRKRFGAANQTRPVAVSGCARDFKARVWMTSADQVWIWVCELSQAPRTELAPQAGGCQPRTQRNTHRKLNAECRMPNAERNPKLECRKALCCALAGFVIGISSFLRISSLVIRISE